MDAINVENTNLMFCHYIIYLGEAAHGPFCYSCKLLRSVCKCQKTDEKVQLLKEMIESKITQLKGQIAGLNELIKTLKILSVAPPEKEPSERIRRAPKKITLKNHVLHLDLHPLPKSGQKREPPS